ncbi:MAG: nucleotidyltransferase family protein [Gemmatimonadaceae bacterium]
MIAAIVLAAGQSKRFGSPKILAPLGGVPLVRHVVERLQDTSVAEIIVVAGDEADEMGRAIHGLRARLAVNPRPEEGMSESLRIGLHAAPADAAALLIVLGDQPLIEPLVIELMIAAWRGGRGMIIAPEYEGQRGNPVLFDGTLRAELMLIEGDQGARQLLESYSSYVYRLPVDRPMPKDVDTVDDLQVVARELADSPPAAQS